MVLGQLAPRKIAPNPNRKRDKIFLRGNCPVTVFDLVCSNRHNVISEENLIIKYICCKAAYLLDK